MNTGDFVMYDRLPHEIVEINGDKIHLLPYGGDEEDRVVVSLDEFSPLDLVQVEFVFRMIVPNQWTDDALDWLCQEISQCALASAPGDWAITTPVEGDIADVDAAMIDVKML